MPPLYKIGQRLFCNYEPHHVITIVSYKGKEENYVYEVKWEGLKENQFGEDWAGEVTIRSSWSEFTPPKYQEGQMLIYSPPLHDRRYPLERGESITVYKCRGLFGPLKGLAGSGPCYEFEYFIKNSEGDVVKHLGSEYSIGEGNLDKYFIKKIDYVDEPLNRLKMIDNNFI